jgi:hypothetical protein
MPCPSHPSWFQLSNNFKPWRWRQHIPLKGVYPPTKLQAVA